jgi:hypothetical protein
MAEIYDQDHVGVKVIPNFLPAELRVRLLEYFNDQRFHRIPLKYGEVEQDMLMCRLTESDLLNSPISDLMSKYVEFRNGPELSCRIAPVDLSKLYVVSNLYPAGSRGITPHRDLTTCENLVAVYVLYGDAPFYTADDKQYNGEIAHPAPVNSLILMRAARCPDEQKMRPVHYIKPLVNERCVIVFREEPLISQVWSRGQHAP